MPRICLVTPGHLASNPRLVKEADALHQAGHSVHVVFLRSFPAHDARDAAIIGRAGWSHTRVEITRVGRRLRAKLIRNLTRATLACGWPINAELAARSHHMAVGALAKAAALIPADLYIGHCLAGLVAAARAACLTGARYGFDAEDFHSAETSFAENDSLEHAIIATLERCFLPGCDHLTASAPLIGEAYVRAYGLPRPEIILNVFPREEAPPKPVPRPPFNQKNPARIYWFSQTIGPGRGLEDFLPIIGALQTPVELHLRGFVSPGYKTVLTTAALASGLRSPIVFEEFAGMSRMARLAAENDLGLSIEPSTPLNRDFCLSNKIFTYLLAGVPQLLSPTAAHKALAPSLGPAAWLADLKAPSNLARRLDAWLADPAAVHAARLHAWELGQARYNWDFEKAALVAAVKSTLSSTASP